MVQDNQIQWNAPYPLGRTDGSHDPKNRAYPVRSILRRSIRPWRYWHRNPRIWDQGFSSTCVPHAVCGSILTGRTATVYNAAEEKALESSLRHIYDLAQQIDPWPGSESEEPRYKGTSTLAGIKATKQYMGIDFRYRWCFSIGDIVDTLISRGPVIVGCQWREGMFFPDQDGYIYAKGPNYGGHAVYVIGVNKWANKVRIVNSWGAEWGENGRAWMKIDDLDKVVSENGEAAIITKS